MNTTETTEIISAEHERLIPIILDFIWRHWGMDHDDVHGNARDGRPTADHLRDAMTNGIPYRFGKSE